MFELVGSTVIEIELVLTQMLKVNQNLVGAPDPVGRNVRSPLGVSNLYYCISINV